MSPHYEMYVQFSVISNVFNFEAMILEIINGKREKEGLIGCSYELGCVEDMRQYAGIKLLNFPLIKVEKVE